jgi:hypothetical protein
MCAIMQPTYLPWLGYFDLIRSADTFVVYDHVQFEKQSWQQRNRIRDKIGEIMLTVPVMHGNGLNRNIKDVRIDNSRNFLRKHLNSIKHSYARSRNFDSVYSDIENIYNRKREFLIDLNLDLISTAMKYLSIEKNFKFSSEMDIKGQKVESLIDVCQKVGAIKYLSPVGAKVYVEENNLFPHHQIKLLYQEFAHPVYIQMNYTDFISHLSFIDYIFNVDLDEVHNFGLIKGSY